ncbi:MAG: hypothetical protein V4596_12155 [Bdellovibrionota bacterium]
MKKIIFLEILNELKAKPHLMKKVKIFAVVGFVGLLITGALTIWAGLTVMNYVAIQATNAVQSPVAQMNIESLKSEVEKLPKLQALSCWNKAQSLIAVQPWLERPALENLANLKSACLEDKITSEGSTI